TAPRPIRVPWAMPTRKAHGTLMGLGAVHATAVGLRPAQVAVFVGAPLVGGLAFQVPIGWLSDRIPRRGVMVAVAAVAAAAGLLAATADPGSYSSYLWMFVIGGMSFPLYSLGVAYTNDWLEPDQMLGASAALVMAVGVGAVLGPLATTALTVVFGPSPFYLTLTVVHAVVVGYLLYRIATNRAPTLAEQGAYVPFPARASATAAQLLQRRRNGRPR
ncbi:MAG: MFS transporter, partial [Actinomycetota bacterium]